VKFSLTHAVIETGGKQYRVAEGDVIFIEKLPQEAAEKVTFDKVLAVVGDGVQNFGTPTVAGASVTGTIVKSGKAKKVIVYKMHAKKGYRRKQGHRQAYTKVQIEKISV
jgi:large subunit ribosomal protein L21